jgi:sugar phosphate isomerase/epimerase
VWIDGRVPTLPTPPSVQLYSVREAFAADPAATLARLAGLGLTRVEPFDLTENAALLATLLPENGLTAPSAHERFLATGVTPALEAAAQAGVELVIDPFVEPEHWQTRESVDAIAAGLNAAVGQAADMGLRIGYHNHAHELTSVFDGVTALEYFVDRLDERVVLEIDTYWAAIGGQDPVALLGRLGERVAAVHLKDGKVPGETIDQAPLGRGDLPVAEIVRAVPAAAVGVLEFDEYAGDLFDGIAASLAYLAR